MSEHLTFKELVEGRRFIMVEQLGDDDKKDPGNPRSIFIKTIRTNDVNAIRIKNGSLAGIPDSTPIIPVE